MARNYLKVIMWATAALLIVTAAFQIGCSDSKPKESEEKTCVEPDNPYQEGTGHYAGCKWAENNGGNCNGNSNSFNEGCEEYHSQENEYEECQARNK